VAPHIIGAPDGVLEEDDMTPQERQLTNELFQRLASLESNPRDPDAEAMIREGLRRAPNAVYSLVQTVLVQDEALKAANNRIQEYEQAYGAPQQQQEEQPRGFLDSVRGSIFGREEPRGSVPRVPQGGAPMGTPWGQGGGHVPGYQNAPMQAPVQSGGGGSFLGTAAGVAAGVIGGSLLMGGIRSALGGHQGGPASKAFEDAGGGGDRSPWSGNAAGSDLAREAGLNDIGGGRSGSGAAGEGRRAGLFDSNDKDSNDSGDDSDVDDSGDDGDSGDSEE
jgi:hypothetical protein